jgi:glycosyltransferase involved in cell wall biosynthesis
MSIATLRKGVARAQRPEEIVPAGPQAAIRPGLHICFIAPYAWPVISADARIAEIGGAEVQQSLLARLFAANGYRVSMICLDYGQAERTLIDGVTVHKAYRQADGVPVLRYFHPRLTTMWRAIQQADADVYYCRAAGGLLYFVTEFCRRRGKRSIYAGASDVDFAADLRGKIRYARDRWLYRRGLGRVDAIVAQNEAQRASCRANVGREALVIPSCYVPPHGMPRSRAGEDVLWVGMIRTHKRPELALELARRLPHRRFVMVGGPGLSGGALYERIRREAASLPNVEMTGFLPLAEVESRFDAARVLVNTSTIEGMPNTFLQAWARGVPTLGTVDVGTPVHTYFSDLDEGARRIEALITDRSAWELASARSREYFERSHSGAETLRRYGELFEALTS